MNLVHEVCVVLDDNLVGYDLMRLDSSSARDYHVITDHSRVLVKLLKPEHSVGPLNNEVLFSVNSNYGTNPLVEHTQHKDSSGFPIFLSAWEWERCRPHSQGGLNVVEAAQAGRELFKFHALSRYEGLVLDPMTEFTGYTEKLKSYSFNYLTADSQSRLKDVFTYLIQPNSELLDLAPDFNVVSHGSLAPEKLMLRTDGTVFWSDYRHVRSAPREYDLAYMYLHLRHRLNSRDSWELFKASYSKDLNREVNEHMLNQFCGLLLGRRALTLASKTLHTDREDKLKSFLKELEPLVKGVPVQDIKSFSHLH
jgi:hypothetical protein